MAVAYADTVMVERRCVLSGPEIFQVDTSYEKQLCTNCAVLMSVAHFWGHRGGNGWRKKAWFRTRWCASCRARGGHPSRSVAPGELTVHQRNRLELEQLSAARNLVKHDTYKDEAGLRRCNRCKSPIYRHVTVLQTNDHPVGYIVTWLCWWGGHEVLERWRVGSMIPKRFPTSFHAPLLSDSIRRDTVKTEPLKPIQGFMNRTGRKRVMRIVRLDVDPIEGCDARCVLLRYLDPDDDYSPTYVRRIHSAEAHNDHESRASAERTFSWNGLTIDFEEYTVRVDGFKTESPLTPIEWRIMKVLVGDFGKVVVAEKMLVAVWGDSYKGSVHLLRVNMARLRKKIRDVGGRFIETTPGVGYRLGRGIRPQQITVDDREAVVI